MITTATMSINPVQDSARSLSPAVAVEGMPRWNAPGRHHMTWIVLLESRRIRVCEWAGEGATAQLLTVPGLDLALPSDAAEPVEWVRARLMVLMGRLLGLCREGGRFERLFVVGDGDGPDMFRRHVDAATRLAIVREGRLAEAADVCACLSPCPVPFRTLPLECHA